MREPNLLQNFKTRGIAKSCFSCYEVLIMLSRTKEGNQCCPGAGGAPSFPCPSASPDFHEWILDAKKWQTIATFEIHSISEPYQWPSSDLLQADLPRKCSTASGGQQQRDHLRLHLTRRRRLLLHLRPGCSLQLSRSQSSQWSQMDIRYQYI